jgi:hypothetical protein
MYEKLLRVFEQSVKENDPKNDVIVKMVAPPNVKRKHCFASNTHKLAIWVDEMKKLPEGHEICFIDCDMMVLKSPSDVFNLEFDLAYTKRPKPQGHRLPVNGGVVFCRNNERSRQFMMKWKEVNDKMYNNKDFHERWRKKYAGMNQSAFGYLMEHPKEYSAKLIPVECNTYNVCNESWHQVGQDSNIRIVHIKSDLRKMCIDGVCRKPAIRKAVEKWQELYCKAGGPDIKVQVVPFKKSNKPGKRNPIPAAKKKRTKNNHKLDFGSKDDETICNLIGRQKKRRLYTP